MRSLPEIAKELRQRAEQEWKDQEGRMREEMTARCKEIDALFISRMGEEYMQAFDAAGIHRALDGSVRAGRITLTLRGQDTLGYARSMHLPINEEIVSNLNPDIMIMLVDKYILRGYPLPPINADGTIWLNTSLEDLGPAMEIFNAN